MHEKRTEISSVKLSLSEEKSASELKELFTQLKVKYGFLRVRKIVCLAARDVLQIFEAQPQLQALEYARTYRELFDNLKKEFPFLSDNREMIYFLLIGVGLHAANHKNSRRN